MSLSPDQLALRASGVAASEVGAIVGCNPYKSSVTVWREKRGEIVRGPDTERTKWGDILEPVVRADYEQRKGVRVEVPGTMAHPEIAWMMASPDGLVYRAGAVDPDIGLEIKTHTFRVAHLYGPPGSDEVPPYELVQCMWGMAVTGLPRWDLVAFIDGQPTDYIIDRDDELIGILHDRCERFLVDNVQGGQPPDPDGTEEFDAWLNARHASNTTTLVDVGDDPEVMALIARGKEVRAQGKELDEEHATIIQRLKVRIGAEGGLTWRDAKGKPEKITWKRSKASRRIDYAGIANDTRADARLALSAKNGEFERAIVCLKSMGEHAPVGHSSQAAITAGQLVDLVTSMRDLIAVTAMRTDAAYTHETPGNRPLCWPRGWASPIERKESDS